MENFEFKHDAENIHDALGISSEIHGKIIDSAIHQIVEHDAITSKVIEGVLKDISPKSLFEAIYIGFAIKSIINKMESDPMLAIASVLKHHNPVE